MGRALEVILTGRVVGAEEALAWGLVTEVVPAGRHLERALEIAEGLALEAELARASVATGGLGAGRVAAGEGRGAAGAGV